MLIDHVACSTNLIYNIESISPACYPTSYRPAIDRHSNNHIDHTY